MGKANIASDSSPARRLKKWSGTGSRKTPSYVVRSCLQIPFSTLLGSDRVRRMLHLYSRTNDERRVSLRWGHNMDGYPMTGQRPLISKFYGKSATPYPLFIWMRGAEARSRCARAFDHASRCRLGHWRRRTNAPTVDVTGGVFLFHQAGLFQQSHSHSPVKSFRYQQTAGLWGCPGLLQSLCW